jgi:hypothetical protein
VLASSNRQADKKGLDLVHRAISRAKAFILHKCTVGAFDQSSSDVQLLDLYKTFYRKLTIRDRSLPRPWVFTTNYDLFNEMAMDELGLPFCNGFSGTIDRRFNPASFRYSLAEQLDISDRRLVPIDGFVYLCKLHGSVSWVEDEKGLFPIRELQQPAADRNVMIYPTPAKQSSTFGAPYSDLFREFQSRAAREQSVLFTLGYSFGDEHVNNIIYQSLTIPTFRLVIFASPDTSPNVAKLRALGDPRIWIVSGETPDKEKAQYFEQVVKLLLPASPSDKVEAAIAHVVDRLMRSPAKDGGHA